MSKKSSSAAPALPDNLPEDFFDSNKKSKKAQEDDLAMELEQFEKEMAALQAESEAQLSDEFEKLQEDKNLDELDRQIGQWKKVIELEKKAEELRNKPLGEKPTKKFKKDNATVNSTPAISQRRQDNEALTTDDQDLDDIEDFEDKLFDWRSKGL